MESKSREQLLREEFEAWAEEAGALPWGYLKKQRNPSGGYSIQIYTYMWEAWQASRAALVVELPEWFVSDAIAVYDRDKIEEALGSARITVKGEGDDPQP